MQHIKLIDNGPDWREQRFSCRYGVQTIYEDGLMPMIYDTYLIATPQPGQYINSNYPNHFTNISSGTIMDDNLVLATLKSLIPQTIGLYDVPTTEADIEYHGNGIICSCRQNIPLHWLYKYEIEWYIPPVKTIDKITVGSDIEFHLVKDETDIGDSGFAQNTRGEIGTDHGGRVGELRPQFGYDPIEHCDNLKKTIQKLVGGQILKPDVFLDASHLEEARTPVGGHIHFGIRDPRIIEACNYNLKYWLLPTIAPLFPKPVFLKRIESRYGAIDGETVRTNEHGFEFRSIPSFIFDEGVTKGIICLAYVIVKLTAEQKLKVRFQEKDSSWIQNFYMMYNKHDMDKLKDLREENIKKLLNKNLLGGLSKYIHPLFDAIKYEAKFSGDIAEGWGMDYEYANVLNSRDEEITQLRDAMLRSQHYVSLNTNFDMPTAHFVSEDEVPTLIDRNTVAGTQSYGIGIEDDDEPTDNAQI